MPAVYTNSKSQVLRGAAFSLGGPVGTTPTYVLVGETVSGSFSGAKRNVLDNTNMQSGQYSEKLDTQIDSGQLKLVYNRVSNDAGQVALQAAFAAGGVYQFEIALPLNPRAGQVATGDLITFAAIISGGPEFEIMVDKVAQTSITLDITGAITLVVGS